MPPRIRTRASKAMKENLVSKKMLKSNANSTKANRKVLADNTNSASDETCDEIPQTQKTSNCLIGENNLKSDIESNDRPRRGRRLPNRFVLNPISESVNNKETNLTNTTVHRAAYKDTVSEETAVSSSSTKTTKPFKTGSKPSIKGNSPLKLMKNELTGIATQATPLENQLLDTSLVMNRPRRICRLPSRFDDHFVSPTKIMSVQPNCNATSTPLQHSKLQSKSTDALRTGGKKPTLLVQPSFDSTRNCDDNNNGRYMRSKRTVANPSSENLSPKTKTSKKSLDKTVSPEVQAIKKISNEQKKSKGFINKSLSFQVLGGKKKLQETISKGPDIYEFTFDPTEEPKHLKKIRKKPTVKRQKVVKPKPTYKTTYDQNISKALSALKKVVKDQKTVNPSNLHQIQEIREDAEHNSQNHEDNGSKNTDKTSVYQGNYPSIRIEDIAADIEPSVDDHVDLNYSPVNTPRPHSSASNPALETEQNTQGRSSSDPLNLQEDLSFFDDIPVASSSMNTSVRHPLASPWRVEFGSLPIKWPSNTYVKPNMTPAVESSFICTEDSNKKKHVYTNMLADTNDPFLQPVSDNPGLKQTSIISYIKEIAEKKANKKRGRSVSPSKAMTNEFSNIHAEANVSSKTQSEWVENHAASSEEVCEQLDTSKNTENCKEKRKSRKRVNDENVCSKPTKSPRKLNDENVCNRPKKSPRKQKDKNHTYFGFDDSEDQENISPSAVKSHFTGRSLRSRTALQEINGPTRAALSVVTKPKIVSSSEAADKVFEGLKQAAEPPLFPEKNTENNITNSDELCADDSQSVHLFEDIEIIHHLKPTRKSYGKAKKVTFRQPSDSDLSDENTVQNDEPSFEDDLGDLTFDVLEVQEEKKAKKKRPKKLRSKKEEKEAEKWAAGFNSMCEEIEEFPLVVE